MKTVGLFEAKRKFSELVTRASEGEQIGITRRGKLTAILAPPQSKKSVKEIFDDIEKIRKRVKPLPEGMTIKNLIEEGRR